MQNHDRFTARLEKELIRARFFSRPLSLLMLRNARREPAFLGRWGARLEGIVRPVDQLAIYGPNTIELLLPEAGSEQAMAIARGVIAARKSHEGVIVCGVASFPQIASAEALIEASRAAAQRARSRAPIAVASAEAPADAALADEIIVHSPAMQRVYELVDKVARSPIPVLIEGETGSGKELIAQAIHQRGRPGQPLRSINCGAIPAALIESALFGHEKGAFTGADARRLGLFEEAGSGTVFLDEVGELSPSAQVALLRVLESKRISRVGAVEEIAIDARVVAATNRDLEQMCQSGSFRLDLLYRLNTITIALPPLRERAEEIAPLAGIFVKRANQLNSSTIRGVEPDAMDLLCQYHWPGNVRELRNVIERAVVMARGEVIAIEDLSERVRQLRPQPAETLDLKARLQNHEIDLIVEALRRADWNQTRAAELLGVPRRTLVRKIQSYGLQKRKTSTSQR